MALQLHVGETVFSYGHFMFPTPVNGIVDTQGFLKAAEGINYFIDLFCGGSKSVAVGHPFNVVSALSSMPKSVALGGPLTQLALGHVRTVHKDVISHVALINLKRNLELVSSAYNNNPKRYATINEMVENELEAGEDAVIDALLWTKRCLHFGQLTMEYLVADYKRGDFDGDVLPHLKRAYKNALVKYHNILTTNSANVCRYVLICSRQKRSNAENVF
ncbi:uncharacterized protein LOC132204517 isoform X2 [Neocloeon triangulifer]|uniref:uncharacterized protein LOC132204517 isoform X2 n=1 Tax=Neocloeon triangulifer TaxID=2078957 RepID=UPI00286F974E|nr:uncharacterized protein LOC132204517 isoform X2 [Neocloeon triangulifer]